MSNVVRKQFFANGSITFPAGVTVAKFKGCGGGGGGGGGGGSGAGTNGGGGGAGGAAVVAEAEVLILSNRQYDVVIAAGGAGGTSGVGVDGGQGLPGGDTTVKDSISGFVLVGFRGASGAVGGVVGATTPALGGANHSSSAGGNVFDLQTALGLTPPPILNPVVLPRSGGSGGIPAAAGLPGGYDPLSDGTIIGIASIFSGGAQGTGAVGGGGGGGGGGGSALGPGGAGGVGSTGTGGTGASAPGANTGAGGGGGGGGGQVGTPVAGGVGGAGAAGYVEVEYTLQ